MKKLLFASIALTGCTNTKDYCDVKLPERFKIVYNKTTDKYAIKETTSWGRVYFLQHLHVGGRIYAMPFDPESFYDSCSAKVLCVKYMEQNERERIENDFK